MIEKKSKLNIPKPKETKRYKVIVLGDAGVGKSQLLNQYCNGKFDAVYNSTVAIDYQTRSLQLDKAQIQFNFWDFSGHPEFYEVRNEFYREADAMLLIMDLSLKQTLHGLDMWIREANENGVEGIPVFVIGNKMDKSRTVSQQDGYTWAEQRKYPYYETSAADNKGLETLFQDLANKINKK